MGGVPPHWKLFVCTVSLPLFHVHLFPELKSTSLRHEFFVDDEVETEGGNSNAMVEEETIDLLKLTLEDLKFTLLERPYDR